MTCNARTGSTASSQRHRPFSNASVTSSALTSVRFRHSPVELTTVNTRVPLSRCGSSKTPRSSFMAGNSITDLCQRGVSETLFEPAELGGKKVRQLVQQRFQFQSRQMSASRIRWLFVLSAVACMACSDSSGPKTITLPLRSVDSKALPAQLPSGTATVTIFSGRVVGSAAGPACSFYIKMQGFNEESFGSVSSCTVKGGDVVTLSLNLGGPPWPSGVHSYRFEQ
jgi:hypothetical protein